MLRLFIGIEPPEKIAEQLSSLQAGLPLARWVPKEKLHVNLAFLGNVNEDQARDVHEMLKQVQFPAFSLTFQGLGYFADADRPHHLWCDIQDKVPLQNLHAKINKIVHDCRIHNDKFHQFIPHLSLASLRGTSLTEVMSFIAANNLFKTDSFQVEHFSLISSHARDVGDSGKYYRIEAQYPLLLP